MVGSRWRGLVLVAISVVWLSSACTSGSTSESAPPVDPAPAAASPPPVGGWSVSLDSLSDENLCTKGHVAFCAPPPTTVVPPAPPPVTEGRVEDCPPDSLCAAFATPPGRIQPGPKPEGVPDMIVVPDTYEDFDVSDDPRPPDVEIPPATQPPPPPPVIG